ncbi:hypothetical protein CVT25_012284 [Psilocybe cyanescens]|uniref:Uncharacterized protein n=1 Tax=Psilocybe cyanescens TaxID=93625 RepID=A0A409XH93_PSICY|nr:hypothetical protein CVT25_012284 [Psilocybe cyanescens]
MANPVCTGGKLKPDRHGEISPGNPYSYRWGHLVGSKEEIMERNVNFSVLGLVHERLVHMSELFPNKPGLVEPPEARTTRRYKTDR